MTQKHNLLILSAATILMGTSALAQVDTQTKPAAADLATEEDSADESSEPAVPAPESTSAAPNPAKGRRGLDKDTEGTKAPNRFQGDSVIKSQYHFNGEPLEVDPD